MIQLKMKVKLTWVSVAVGRDKHVQHVLRVPPTLGVRHAPALFPRAPVRIVKLHSASVKMKYCQPL
jgi:hypothetical protein